MLPVTQSFAKVTTATALANAVRILFTVNVQCCRPLANEIKPRRKCHISTVGGQKYFWATVCKTVRPMLSVRCLSVCPVCPVLSVCDVHALWPNGWTDQDETWHAGRPRPWPHCVRWEPSCPSPKGHSPHQLSAYICCGPTAG